MSDRTAAMLVLAAVTCLYLWRVLVGGEVLSPSSLLYKFVPWQPAAPPDLHSYYNNFLSDAATEFEPWRLFAREQLRAGVFPSWNPYVLGGTPFFANAQTELASPFLIPQWLLPFNYALGVVAALKLWTAGLGAYFLGRELRLSFWPAILAGACFALCAFNIVWLSHPHTAVAPMLPWALWLSERVLRRGRAVDVALLALPLAVAFLGGHPGTEVHVAFAVVTYAAVRAGIGMRERRLRRFGLVLLGSAAGAAMAAVALLPAIEVVSQSNGQVLRQREHFTLSLKSIITVAFPDFGGRPSATSLNDFIDNYQERTMFAGAVALLLAPVGLLWGRAWRRTVPFAVLAVLGLGVALGLQPFDWVVTHLPVFDTVRNPRMVLYVQLAVALLGGFGLERALTLSSGRRLAQAVALAGMLAGLLALVMVAPSFADLKHTARHFLTGADFPGFPDVIRATAITWWLLFAVATGAAMTLLGRARTAGLVALTLVVALDLGRFVNGYQPMGPPDRVFPPSMPAIRALHRDAGDGRTVAVGFNFPPDVNIRFDLRDARGYDPPDPPLRYAHLWSGSTSPLPQDGPGLDALSAQKRRVIDVMGVRAVLANPGIPLKAPHLRLTYQNIDALVYRNDSAAPRVSVPSRVLRVHGEREAVRTVLSPGFDPRRQAVAETQANAGAGRARVVNDRFSSVELRADMRRRGLVLLNETLRKGWTVRVDGRAAEPVRVDSIFRGVTVPAGTHRVEWRYRTPGLAFGAGISGAVLLGWLALMASFAYRRRSAA
jgi:hypothetical protein